MESNEKVLREAAHAYNSAGLDGIVRTQPDLIGHRELLAGLHADFANEVPTDLIDRVCSIRAPNDCISVLLMGNHSAGKSSFVNWYVGDQVQTTSVAVRRQESGLMQMLAARHRIGFGRRGRRQPFQQYGGTRAPDHGGWMADGDRGRYRRASWEEAYAVARKDDAFVIS